MCTSLIYRDAKGRAYCGRTMELGAQLAYEVAFVPQGQVWTSETAGSDTPLRFVTNYGIIGVFYAPPEVRPAPRTFQNHTIVDGMNSAGLVFNVLAYPDSGGPQPERLSKASGLNVIDLGAWALGQFSTVNEVRAALEAVTLKLEPLDGMGSQPPFHYSLYDREGDAIVIEFHEGKLTIYDNPVGVMTNGPQFSWHLININNYAHLDNRDRSAGRLGQLDLRQPDAGISMAGIPSDTTSVGRFVKAAYFATFAEKVCDPDVAVRTLSHIMNNFDRVRGLSVTDPETGDAFGETLGLENSEISTEYTTWTQLSDTARCHYHVRAYEALNFTRFDLKAFDGASRILSAPLASLPDLGGDGIGLLQDVY
ncbi:penicillin V acylase-like amidase (Ntn superfamily) [Labrenzia sp. EL_195]|nr:penicillin V acylase-like amidase (Ntn superfamily) [Labrenzia sp. EL_195]